MADGVAWLVRGDDATLVGEGVRRLVHELSGGDAMSVEDLSGDDVGVGAVVEACQTPPFLADRRVVVAREVGRFTSDELAPLLAWLAAPLPTTALVLGAGGGTMSVKLVNAVKKAGTVVDTAVGSRPKDRTSWVEERVAAGPVRLDRAATRQLADHLGEDVSRLGSLLETLAASYGRGARVGTEELEPFLGEAGGVAPWDLTDAVDAGRTADALVVLHRMMAGGGRHPLALMATLHRHYGAMLRLDGAEVSGEQALAELLGMAPYPARKVADQARRIGSAAIARAIELLAAADLGLRGTSGLPDQLVMEVLVARLCALRRR
ncbi:MAG: DNA polymerase III subunit delta [Acidimicrobiales bacterium]